MNSLRAILAFLFILSVLFLSGCSDLFPKSGQNLNLEETTVPTLSQAELETLIPELTEPDDSDDKTVEFLSTVVTEQTIRNLDEYTNLKSLDLSGSTCYTAIMVYAKAHPDVEVTYYVDFGEVTVINWAEDAAFLPGSSTYQLLKNNLVYLPYLKHLHLPSTSLSYSEIDSLRCQYPDIEITYTADVLGVEYSEDTEQINLYGISTGEFSELAISLERLPNLKFAELMENSYCSLNKEQVKQLKNAIPYAKFHYIFNLFGRTVSTTDENISFKNLSLTEANESEIRDALELMAPGTSLILDNCGLSSEFLASIREDYSDVDLVWRVTFGVYGRYSTLTNDDTIRTVYNVTDDTCSEMKYLRSVKYMDLGHNDTLTDLSFVAYMPDLEILIASGCAVQSLEGFENCKKLEFLELANCLSLKDITALSGCSSLRFLNICYTKISDLSALDGLPLEVLFCKRSSVNAEEQKVFKEIHPNCLATFVGREPYAGPGWRYTDNGYTYTAHYKKVREVFDLDAVDRVLRAQQNAK